MTTNTTLFASRPLWASFAIALLAVPAAFAGDYDRSSYGGNYGGYHGGYHGGGYHSSPAPSYNSNNSGRRYYYSTGYRSGNGGFGWLNYRSGEDDNNGYSGSYAGDNRPHRADWEAKLQAQRQWDEKQYAKMQGPNGDLRCGLSGAPAYCYRLQGPYPTEFKVVRY